MKTFRTTTEILAATFLTLFVIASPVTLAATIAAPTTYPQYKPYTYQYGTVTNTILAGQSAMNYNPSAGIEKTLPYNFSGGKLTFPLANVAFKGNLLNGSVKGTTTSSPAGLTLSTVQLLSTNGISYISATAANSSDLTANTAYTVGTTDKLDPTVAVTSASNIVATGFISGLTGVTTFTLPSTAPFAVLGVVDTGGLLHSIEVTWAQLFASGTTAAATTQTPASSLTATYATGSTSGLGTGTYYTVQVNLGHLLSLASYTWTPSVIQYITYGVSTSTGPYLGHAQSISFAILNAFVTTTPVLINGATLYNGTKSTQTFSLTVSPTTAISPLTISQPWTQVAGVSFPFVYAPSPTETLYPDQLQIGYSWSFPLLLANVTSMSFSNVNINMSMNSLTPNMFNTLYINGGSYSATIAAYLGTTTGTLLTGLATATVYTVQALVTYTSAEYDGATQVPSVYQNPGAWFEANFWYIIVGIAAVFGIGGGAYAAKARELRIPK